MAMSQRQDFAKALTDYARQRLDRLEGFLEQAVDNGDVDAIHDLRVASRRLTEPIAVMAHWLGRKSAARVRRGLGDLRECFQIVRDLDVLQVSLAGPDHPGLDAPDMAQLEGLLTRRRERAMDRARKAVASLDSEKLLRRVEDYCDDFYSRRPDAQCVWERVREAFQRRSTVLLEHRPTDPGLPDLHDTRIRVKRMRYCADLATRIDAIEPDGLIASLTAIQELLGSWNDQLVAARWIAKIARRRVTLTSQTGWAARLLEYSAMRLRRADGLRSQVLDAWPPVEAALGTCEWAVRSPASNDAAASSVEAT